MTLEEYIRMQEMMRDRSRTSTGIIPGLSGPVDPNYLGNVVSGRPRMTRPVGMTDADVDYWTRYGGPVNLMSRQPAQGAATGVTAMPRTGSQAYADLAAWRASQPPLPVQRGLPSGYGQEEGGMEEPYLGWRPTGTALHGVGVTEHDPRFGGPWEFGREGQPMGWLRHGGTAAPTRDPVSAGHVGGGAEGRTRGVEAEEGPASGLNFSASALSKASEMIAAAGGGTAGGMTKKGGGFRKAPGPWMAGPRSITAFAPVRLGGGKQKREDEIYG
jgi:hypothetical protein